MEPGCGMDAGSAVPADGGNRRRTPSARSFWRANVAGTTGPGNKGRPNWRTAWRMNPRDAQKTRERKADPSAACNPRTWPDEELLTIVVHGDDQRRVENLKLPAPIRFQLLQLDQLTLKLLSSRFGLFQVVLQLSGIVPRGLDGFRHFCDSACSCVSLSFSCVICSFATASFSSASSICEIYARIRAVASSTFGATSWA